MRAIERLSLEFDAQSDAVLRVGEFTTRDGNKFVSPRLKDLEGKDIWLGSSPLPEAGTGGQFVCLLLHTLCAQSCGGGSPTTVQRHHKLCAFAQSRAPYPGLEQRTVARSLRVLRRGHGVVGSFSIHHLCAVDRKAHGHCRIYLRLDGCDD